MFYRLPPAGDPVEFGSIVSPEESLNGYFKPYEPRFYSSGTCALAAALLAILKRKRTDSPEVLLPGYSCPALVSAILYTGATPVLVDLEENRPWMSLGQLRQKLCERSVAIIAVHLFGIPERLNLIKEIIGKKDIFLIEDSAQCLPKRCGAAWSGDFVIISFGRGKPVSLLGGGAVLTKDPDLKKLLPKPPPRKALRWTQSATFKLKASAYNMFLSPMLYWLPASLPLLHLGETSFKPLKAISAFSESALSSIPAGLYAHWDRRNYVETKITGMLSHFNSSIVLDLPRLCCGPNLPRMLRYPILVLDTLVRDKLFEYLHAAGLGVSRMYPGALAHIVGLEEILASQDPLPCAEKFAKSIITLPTHTRVRSNDVEKIASILAKLI